jgi:ribosomal protein S18 acetylase RimI-like enzyme
MSVSIRLASADDAAVVADVVRRAYTPFLERTGIRPGPLDADYAPVVSAGRVRLAVVGPGEVAGLVVLEEHPDHLLIENVAVDPGWQGRGVGRFLMDHAEAVARAGGLRELRLYTHQLMTGNIAMYRHLGYEETGREVDEGFGRVFFAKRLA